MSVNAERAQIEEEEDDKEGGSVREQDRFLPIANISRIMKKALPANAKIAKDAKETVQECVSEFISFITSEASDKCQREKRKTINGDDLLWAMSTLGFEDYVEPLKVYLNKYREKEDPFAVYTRTVSQRTEHCVREQGEKASLAKQGGPESSGAKKEGNMPLVKFSLWLLKGLICLLSLNFTLFGRRILTLAQHVSAEESTNLPEYVG
eukprot:gene8640-10253_t